MCKPCGQPVLTTKCKRTDTTNVKEGTLNCLGVRHVIQQNELDNHAHSGV